MGKYPWEMAEARMTNSMPSDWLEKVTASSSSARNIIIGTYNSWTVLQNVSYRASDCKECSLHLKVDALELHAVVFCGEKVTSTFIIVMHLITVKIILPYFFLIYTTLCHYNIGKYCTFYFATFTNIFSNKLLCRYRLKQHQKHNQY